MKSLRVAKEGKKSMICSFLIGIIVLSIYFFMRHTGVLLISICMFALVILLLLFFRDPDREIGRGIVSPADGKVVRITKLQDDEIGRCVLVSIFMNLFNVHVNRMPIDGRIVKVERKRGGYYPAFSEKADKNEKNILLVDTGIGKIKIVQIVGFFARRIVCYPKEGENLKKGDRIGMIIFGSRVDLMLPENRIKLVVGKGEKVRAGVDTIADVND